MTLQPVALLLVAAGLLGIGRPAAAQGADPYLEFLTALHLEQTGDVDAARAALERAAAADPASGEILAELAAFHLRQNDTAAAEQSAKAALAKTPESVEAHRVLGVLYASYAEGADETGGESAAREYAGKAIAHLEKVAATPGGVTDINVQYNLGRLYMRAGDTEKAVERLSAVVEGNPYSIQARLSLAQALGAAKRHDEAAEVLAPAVDDEPRLASTLGQIYERAGRRKEAMEAYVRALAANPKDLRALLALAREYSERGDMEKAIDTLTRAQQLVPEDPAVVAFLAQTYLLAKRHGEAAALAAAAQKKHPGDLRFTRLHARALFESGAASRAIALLESTARAHAEDSGVVLSLADLYVDAGREDDALRTLEAAAARFPADADILNFLGYLLAERGERLEESVRLVTRALEIDPENPSYLDSLGWAHLKRGNLAEAEKYLAKAAAGLPRNSVVQDHYGDLLAKLGRHAEAVAAWQRALDGDGEDIEPAAIRKKIGTAKIKMQDAR